MRILGLDVGIASIGWALIELEQAEEIMRKRGSIIACGVWSFDPPEERTRDGALSKAQNSTGIARQAAKFAPPAPTDAARPRSVSSARPSAE